MIRLLLLLLVCVWCGSDTSLVAITYANYSHWESHLAMSTNTSEVQQYNHPPKLCNTFCTTTLDLYELYVYGQHVLKKYKRLRKVFHGGIGYTSPLTGTQVTIPLLVFGYTLPISLSVGSKANYAGDGPSTNGMFPALLCIVVIAIYTHCLLFKQSKNHCALTKSCCVLLCRWEPTITIHFYR